MGRQAKTIAVSESMALRAPSYGEHANLRIVNEFSVSITSWFKSLGHVTNLRVPDAGLSKKWLILLSTFGLGMGFAFLCNDIDP